MAEVFVRSFGTIEGRSVSATRLVMSSGFELEVLDYGAAVRALVVKVGSIRRDIALGLDDLGAYRRNTVFLGGIVGRFANRIAGSRFELEGKTCSLFANDPPHHLHGGRVGWDKVVWTSESSATTNGAEVCLRYESKDGDEGYPGHVSAEVVYGLTESGEFTVAMRARAESPTFVNMAQHNYYNLHGPGPKTTLDHEVRIFADAFTPFVDRVPDGRIASVEGTPLDFRSARAHGERIGELAGPTRGYDHNYVVRGDPNSLRKVAEVREPESGLTMEVEANQPGVQFYSGQFLDGSLSGKGHALAQYSGLCLETQAFPNAVNVPAWTHQALLEPARTYEHLMVHRFRVS